MAIPTFIRLCPKTASDPLAQKTACPPLWPLQLTGIRQIPSNLSHAYFMTIQHNYRQKLTTYVNYRFEAKNQKFNV